MFNFQPSRFLVLCILFSYKSSQIYQHAFQRLFIECITCDHFAFCKAIGILHKFQMYHGLQQGEINFPFNFITFLISSSSFFFFLSGFESAYSSPFGLRAFEDNLICQSRAEMMPSERTAFHLFRDIY